MGRAPSFSVAASGGFSSVAGRQFFTTVFQDVENDCGYFVHGFALAVVCGYVKEMRNSTLLFVFLWLDGRFIQ